LREKTIISLFEFVGRQPDADAHTGEAELSEHHKRGALEQRLGPPGHQNMSLWREITQKTA
jgi:hypothetical protein